MTYKKLWFKKLEFEGQFYYTQESPQLGWGNPIKSESIEGEIKILTSENIHLNFESKLWEDSLTNYYTLSVDFLGIRYNFSNETDFLKFDLKKIDLKNIFAQKETREFHSYKIYTISKAEKGEALPQNYYNEE